MDLFVAGYSSVLEKLGMSIDEITRIVGKQLYTKNVGRSGWTKLEGGPRSHALRALQQKYPRLGSLFRASRWPQDAPFPKTDWNFPSVSRLKDTPEFSRGVMKDIVKQHGAFPVPPQPRRAEAKQLRDLAGIYGNV